MEQFPQTAVHSLIPPAGMSPWDPGVLTLLAFAALVVVLIGALLGLTAIVNPRRDRQEKSRPYECGVIPSGAPGTGPMAQARFGYPTPFYLVAVFFLIFDVESVYIFTWAVSFERLDWLSYLRIAFFIVVLLLGLVYIWSKGGLEWGTTSISRGR